MGVETLVYRMVVIVVYACLAGIRVTSISHLLLHVCRWHAFTAVPKGCPRGA